MAPKYYNYNTHITWPPPRHRITLPTLVHHQHHGGQQRPGDDGGGDGHWLEEDRGGVDLW